MQIIKLADAKNKLIGRNIEDTMLWQVGFLDDQLWKNIDWNVVQNETDMWTFLNNFVTGGLVRGMIDGSKNQLEEDLRYDPDPNAPGLTYAERQTKESQLGKVNTWSSLLLDNQEQEVLTYQQNNAFVYIVANTLMMSPRSVPTANALQKLFDHLKALPKETNMGKKKIIKFYDHAATLEQAEITHVNRIDKSKINGWVEIPGGEAGGLSPEKNDIDIRKKYPKEDFTSVESRAEFMSDMCKGKGWCIGNFETARGYVSDSMTYLLVEGGEPKVCIATSSMGRRVKEVTGACNNKQNVYLYADDLLKFYDDYPDLHKVLDSYSADTDQAISNFKFELTQAKEKIKEYTDMEPKDLARVFSQAAPYLTDSKIDKSKENEEFEQASKEHLVSGKLTRYEDRGPRFEHQINRFPYLKKDPAVIQKGIAHIKSSLEEVYMANRIDQMKIMHHCNPSRLNNKLGTMPMKDSSVRELTFKTYLYLLENQDTDANRKSMFNDISTMILQSGNKHLFEKQAKQKCMEYFMAGDIDKFNTLRIHFDLSEEVEEFKEQAFQIAIEGAPEMLVNDELKFDQTNEYFDEKLKDPEYFDDILAKAVPIAATKVIEAFGYDSFQTIMDMFGRFPSLKTRENVLSSLVDNAGRWMLGNADLFTSINEEMGGYLLEGDVQEEMITAQLPAAIARCRNNIHYEEYDEIAKKDVIFDGRITADAGLIAIAAEKAVDEIVDEEINGFKKMNKVFKNALTPMLPEILDKAFERRRKHIEERYLYGDIDSIKRINKILKGRIMKNKQSIIENTLNDATQRAFRILTIDHVDDSMERNGEFTNSNPIVMFGQLDKLYDGKIAVSPMVVARMKEVYNELLLKKGNPEYDKAMNMLDAIHGGRLVSQKDIDAYMKAQMGVAYNQVRTAINQGGQEDVIEKWLVAFPELKENEALQNFAAQKAMKYLVNPIYNQLTIQDKMGKVDRLNFSMGNTIKVRPDVQRAIANIAPDQAGPENPRVGPFANLGMHDDAEGDPFGDAQATTWYKRYINS